jgi:molybdate transport system permease protein
MNLTSKLERRFAYTAEDGLRGTQKVISKPTGLLSIPNSIRRVRRQSFGVWLLILPSILLLTLFGLPLLALIARAVQGDFLRHVFSAQALSALKLSLTTSLITVLLTICGGTPLGYILARWTFPQRSSVQLLIDLPIVLPPSVAGIALLIAFGRQGFLGPLLTSFHISLPFTVAAVVLAQTFVAAPLYIRAARIGFSAIDIQIEEAARVEGATQWQLFCHVMFPLSKRALTGGAILTWTRALGEFGATMLFAGNLEGVTQTMPMAIYLGFQRNLGTAIALSVVLIAISVLLLGLTRRLERYED